MKHYLVDTNVVLDMLADRQGVSDAACEVFDAAGRGEIKLSMCALSYSNIYYILRKQLGHSATIESLQTLSESVSILPVDEYVIQQSLKSGFQDYEDAIQYYSAIQDSSIIGIITRNAKDFRQSKLPILEPSEWTLNNSHL